MSHYIDNKEFSRLLFESIENGKLSEKTILAYKLIVDNMITNRRFNRYPEDIKANMQNNAYYVFLKYWKGYKHDENKAFSYFTKMCERAYIQEILRYYKYNEKFDTIYNNYTQSLKEHYTSEGGIDDEYR